MKPRALIDCDGPLADFHEPCLEIVNRLTSRKFTIDMIDGWNIFESLLREFPEDEQRRIKSKTYQIMKEPGWCRALPVCPGALEGIKLLRSIGDVIVVTSPMDGPTWMRERAIWLERHFDLHPENDVIHTARKEICAGHVLVDDKTSTCVKWGEHHDGVSIRWLTGANAREHYDGVSTRHWPDVAELLQQQVEHHVREENYPTWRSR